MKKLPSLALIAVLLFGTSPVHAHKKSHHKKRSAKWAYVKIATGSILGCIGMTNIVNGSCSCPCFLCLRNPMTPCKKMVLGVAMLFPAGVCIKSGIKDLEKHKKTKLQKIKKKIRKNMKKLSAKN